MSGMLKYPIYVYKGKTWCDLDLSEETDYYGGDLYDLFCELEQAGFCYKTTFYCTEEKSFDNEEDVLADLAEDGRISDVGVRIVPY